MVANNPHLELLFGGMLVMVWAPVLAIGAYRMTRWMMERVTAR